MEETRTLDKLCKSNFTLTSFPAGLSKPDVDVSEDLSRFSLSEESSNETGEVEYTEEKASVHTRRVLKHSVGKLPPESLGYDSCWVVAGWLTVVLILPPHWSPSWRPVDNNNFHNSFFRSVCVCIIN